MNKNFAKKFRIKELELISFKNWIVSVRPKQPIIGSLVISLKRNCQNLGMLTKGESEELSDVYSFIEILLKEAFSFNKINYLCLMMVDNHVHFHVIPRYKKPVVFNGNKYQDLNWPGPPDVVSFIDEENIELKLLSYLKNFKKPQTKIVGYTTGVFDLFHIGHLNILMNAKKECDYLIVGVTTDELTEQRKLKKPVVELKERIEIIRALSCVDEVVEQESMDKLAAWEKLRFNKMFVGSDWKGTEKWCQLEIEFKKIGVDITYFPYTETTSSTVIRSFLETVRS